MALSEDAFRIVQLPVTNNVVSNAQIRYVRIDKLLADSKSDRSSKYDAFLSCSYEKNSDIFILRGGEVINAVRIDRSHRLLLAINEGLERARKAKRGVINLDKTDFTAAQLFIASVFYTPVIQRLPGKSLDLKMFLKEMNRLRWNGFLELTYQDEYNYLTIEEGVPRKIFFCRALLHFRDQKLLPSLVELLQDGNYIVTVYACPHHNLSQLMEQVLPAQIALLSKIFGDVLLCLLQEIGASGTREMFLVAQQELEEEFPLLQVMSIDLRGNLVYNGISKPQSFIDTLSIWLSTTITQITQTTNIDIVPRVNDVLEPNRVTLESLGFFNNFHC